MRLAHERMAAEGFAFALWLDEAPSFGAWLAGLDAQRRGAELPEGRVPATFLLATVGGTVVGRSSVRHELDAWLAHEGGHVGYGVLPEHRRRGHATEILRQSLVVARAHGVDRVLVTCDDDNASSARVIERCGGVLDGVVRGGDGTPVRRYWIA